MALVATRRARQAHLASRMRRKGRRLTRQRMVVAQALSEAKLALSAKELHERLRARHSGLGLATVYRALEAQVDNGMARRLERAGHVYAYVACDPQHHHHIVCVRCQRSEDLDEGLVRPLVRSIGKLHRFAVDHARLDLYGLCRSCQRAVGRA